MGRRAISVVGLTVLLSAGLVYFLHRSGSSHIAARTTSPTVDKSPSEAPTSAPQARTTGIKLTTVARVQQPVAMAVRRSDAALYVAQKTGAVVRITGTTVDPTPVIDLTGRVSTAFEQGLLGIAWSPDGSLLYVDYTDNNGDTNVVEYRPPAHGTATDGRRVLFVKQPFSNHNGGEVAFGPDGKLYIGLGDGGSERDPNNVGQDLTTLLAKILRIDPTPSGAAAYTIPPDNPFARGGGRPETWAWGLRNPWRFSFDRQSGEQWIGDVGQDMYEEVDSIAARRAGVNFGWSMREGFHQYKGAKPSSAVDPVYEYSHANGSCSVTGGYVYRGKLLADLVAGKYVFGDYCLGDLFVLSGGQARPLDLYLPQLTSFGEDLNGELYALSQRGDVDRLDPVP